MSIELRGAAVSQGAKIREETHDGRAYVVVPVVGLVEGIVHAMGARGPELVQAAEFSRDIADWDGRPVYLGHPLVNGRPVSGNTTAMIAARSIGVVRKPSTKDNKLCMEAWLDVKRCADHAPELLERANAGDDIEISIGAFVRTELRDGEHDGRKYVGVWRDITADHLALLPKGIAGACSFDMGCGVRAAQANSEYGWPLLDAWEDKSGVDDHGRGGAGKATNHENAATAHESAATAHANAASSGSTADSHAASAASIKADAATTKAIGTAPSPNHMGVSQSSANAADHAAGAAAKNDAGRHVASMRSHNQAAAAHRTAAQQHTALAGHARYAQEEPMYEPWLEAGSDALLKTLRSISKAERDKLAKGDFAGPNESFPISEPVDVHDAARAIGRAKGDRAAIKARIISIAYRKGASFVAQLPDDWKKDPKAASLFATMMAAAREFFGTSDTAVSTLLDLAEKKEHITTEADMTKCELTKFLETATDEQLKALSAAAKPPTEAEIKAAADAKVAEDKAKKDAADLKTAADAKAKTIADIKATGKNDLTEDALKALSQELLDAKLKALSAPKAPTFEELLATASSDVRAAINAGVSAANAKKDASIKVLQGTKRCSYTEQELKAMTQDQLDNLVKLADIKVAVDHSVLGAHIDANESTGKVAPPADLRTAIQARNKK